MVDIRERDVDVPRARTFREPRPTRVRRPLSREIVSGTVQFADLAIVMFGGLAAFWTYLLGVLGNADDFDRYSLTTVLAAIVFVFFMRRSGAYQFSRLTQLGWQARQVAVLWCVTVSTLTTWAFVTKVAEVYSRGWSISFAAFTFAGLLLSRVILRLRVQRWRSQGRLVRSVAVVGADQVGEELIAKLTADAVDEVEIVGVFDDRATRVPANIAGFPVLGTTDRLIEIGQTTAIDEIIIALPLRAAGRIGELANKLRLLPTDLRLSIDPIGGAFPMRGVGNIASVPVIEIVDRPLKHWSGLAKNLEDRLLSALCLIVAAPLMALVALAIRLDSSGPVFFRQQRFGFNNHPISVIKFRTMHVDRGDPSGEQRTVRNDPRVTHVGRFLRSWSLDELPQLINVLCGDMSLVGPRAHPIAMKAGDRLYHEAVDDYFHRHRVKPGITGWAQVHGLRGEIDTIEKARQRVAYDLDYIDNWSAWLDFKIVAMSLRILCTRESAY